MSVSIHTSHLRSLSLDIHCTVTPVILTTAPSASSICNARSLSPAFWLRSLGILPCPSTRSSLAPSTQVFSLPLPLPVPLPTYPAYKICKAFPLSHPRQRIIALSQKQKKDSKKSKKKTNSHKNKGKYLPLRSSYFFISQPSPPQPPLFPPTFLFPFALPPSPPSLDFAAIIFSLFLFLLFLLRFALFLSDANSCHWPVDLPA